MTKEQIAEIIKNVFLGCGACTIYTASVDLDKGWTMVLNGYEKEGYGIMDVVLVEGDKEIPIGYVEAECDIDNIADDIACYIETIN